MVDTHSSLAQTFFVCLLSGEESTTQHSKQVGKGLKDAKQLILTDDMSACRPFGALRRDKSIAKKQAQSPDKAITAGRLVPRLFLMMSLSLYLSRHSRVPNSSRQTAATQRPRSAGLLETLTIDLNFVIRLNNKGTPLLLLIIPPIPATDPNPDPAPEPEPEAEEEPNPSPL